MSWREENNCLCADFKFRNFTEAFAFMTEVAFVAEKQNHHPNWSNVYSRVSFQLQTHDAANTVTEKDYALANAIDSLAAKYSR
jgi:4a-hydroxytetrahydrobiopterin dehydratase